MIVDVSVLLGKHRPYLYVLWQIIKKQPKLWNQLLIQLWYFVLYKFHGLNEQQFQEKRWAFLKQVDFEQIQHAFRKVKYNSAIQFANNTEIVDQFPNEILQLLSGKYSYSGLKLDENRQIVYQPLSERLNSEKKRIISPFTASHYQLEQNYVIYFNKHFYQNYRNYVIAEILLTIRDLVILTLLSTFFMVVITAMSGYRYNPRMVLQVLTSKDLIILNILPILCFALILYAIFNSLVWSVGISSFLFLFLGLVNFFMLQYRSYYFKFSDIFLSGEAMNMGHRYSYMPPKSYLVIIALLLILLVIVHFLFKPAKQSLIKSLVLLIAGIVIWQISYQKYYANDTFYDQVAEVKYGSRWNGTNRYMTRGFIYSFVHSVNDTGIKAPAGYSDQKAEQILKKYQYQSIPKKKRINVILIQLEAFQDFSKYQNLQIDPSVYAGLNEVRKQSMSGELTTTIFGGGTVDTERKSLTGYSEQPTPDSNTSSFVRYFDANHYDTLKMHPGYGWFYNRQNTAKYLGFDEFLHKENYYDKHVSKSLIVKDELVFKDLNKQFDKFTKHKKLFAQLVTYQNHGPYPTTYNGKNWLPYKAGYNKADYAVINNYLNGVKQTSDQLLNLVKMFKEKKEPVVIAFWGDHNPWGGNGNSTYKMLGINLDQSTLAGFNNYFNTPYCIWANNSAKKELKTDFNGKGPQISPMYLLSIIFEHIGIKGDSYMQMLQHLQKEVPVFGLNDRYIYDDRLVSKLPKKVQKEVNDFKIVQYYRQTHLLND